MHHAPGASRILTAVKTAAKTAGRVEKIDVVRPHEVMSHANDCLVERLFAMMVGRVQRYISAQLCNSHFLLNVFAEASIENLALSRL